MSSEDFVPWGAWIWALRGTESSLVLLMGHFPRSVAHGPCAPAIASSW